MFRVWILLLGIGAQIAVATPLQDEKLGSNRAATLFGRMSTYCRSCHGVRPLRFFFHEDPDTFFDSLCATQSQASQKSWAEMIVKVLSWPKDVLPSPENLMEPPSKDWMPRGGKRVEFGSDRIDGESTRHLIMQELRERCGVDYFQE